MSQICRRDLLKGTLSLYGLSKILGAAVVTGFSTRGLAATSKAAPANVVPESDPVAKAIGYCHDADQATNCPDRKQPARKKEYCRTCQFYSTVSGKGSDEIGKCQLIAAGPVAAGGWCKSFIKNPKIKG